MWAQTATGDPLGPGRVRLPLQGARHLAMPCPELGSPWAFKRVLESGLNPHWGLWEQEPLPSRGFPYPLRLCGWRLQLIMPCKGGWPVARHKLNL